MAKINKHFHIYIKDSALAEVFNVLYEERSELSQVITELAWNGMDKIVEKRLKIRSDSLRQLKKAGLTLKKTRELRKTRKEQFYHDFLKRHKESPFDLDHKSDLMWIEERASNAGYDPETLLIEFEKRQKKRG